MVVQGQHLEELRESIYERNFKRASEIINGGVSLDEILEEDGNSFLHDACQDGDSELVDYFLRFPCPRTLESFDYIGETPLIGAASNGQFAVVQRLLEAGVNINAQHGPSVSDTAIPAFHSRDFPPVWLFNFPGPALTECPQEPVVQDDVDQRFVL